LQELLDGIPKDYLDEVIIIDDESPDQEKTKKIAERNNIPFFNHPELGNLGYGGNLKYSLRKAVERGADYAVEIHGDGQYDPIAVIETVKKIRDEGIDLVTGSRFTNWTQPRKDGMPLIRFVANIILSFFARLVLRIPWTEFYSGYRAYSKKLIELSGHKGGNNHFFSIQVISIAKYNNLTFGEVPVRCYYHGKHSSISLPESAVYFFNVFFVLTQYLLAKYNIYTVDLFRVDKSF
jgi:glycosyltransferase involved in cell wall biosynthesis